MTDIISYKISRQSDGEFGTVLLRCRWRRFFSAVQIIVGGAVTVVFFAVLLGEKSRIFQSLIGAVVLMSVAAFVIGVRNFVNPFVIFEATSRGVLMYMEGGGVRLAQPFFIPWERVESMEYQVRQGFANGEMHTSRTVALKVKTDAAWTPAAHLRRNYEKTAGCVHLDAVTGSIYGRELLRRMEEIKARYKAA